MEEKGKKEFIIDTNVFIDDPDCIFRMGDNDIIVPDVVIEELDHFKSEESDRGCNVRHATRNLDMLCQKGSLVNGIPLGEGKGAIRLAFTPLAGDKQQSSFPLTLDNNDNRIIYLCRENPGSIIITKDINLRVRANSLGLKSETYQNDFVKIDVRRGGYTGRTKVYLPQEVIKEYKEECLLDLDSVSRVGYGEDGGQFDEEVYPNEFFEIYPVGVNNPSPVLGRCNGRQIVPLYYKDAPMYNVHPRNVGQYFMQEALMQPASVAPLVIIKGIAGTAKTFFSLAAGLEKYRSSRGHKDEYNRILICRPSETMDEKIGFLPGTEKDKISPYMRAIKDNVFALLFGVKGMNPYEYHQAEEKVESMFLDDYIKTESIAYLRGRTLNHYWFILDEMQNSTRSQVKGIITRSGKDSKIILLGDPQQIDNPRNSEYSNGLSYASEKMKGSPLCWQVQMNENECERSKLAQEAAKRL